MACHTASEGERERDRKREALQDVAYSQLWISHTNVRTHVHSQTEWITLGFYAQFCFYSPYLEVRTFIYFQLR